MLLPESLYGRKRANFPLENPEAADLALHTACARLAHLSRLFEQIGRNGRGPARRRARRVSAAISHALVVLAGGGCAVNKPTIIAPADGLFAIAASLDRVADAIQTSGEDVRAGLDGVAFWIKYLGNGDAATRMGAIEGHSKHIGEKLDHLTEVIGDFADALREANVPEE